MELNGIITAIAIIASLICIFTPQLNIELLRQQAPERQPQRRALCIALIVVADTLTHRRLLGLAPFLGGALGEMPT